MVGIDCQDVSSDINQYTNRRRKIINTIFLIYWIMYCDAFYRSVSLVYELPDFHNFPDKVHVLVNKWVKPYVRCDASFMKMFSALLN